MFEKKKKMMIVSVTFFDDGFAAKKGDGKSHGLF